MTIKGSSSAQVARLIEDLLSSNSVARETAAARLAIVGARAVDRLLATLEGLRRPDQAVAVLDVLERIADPRSAVAVMPLLDSGDEALAIGAASVVRVALRAEDADTAAQATTALVKVATDESRPAPVRAAVLTALRDLPADVLEPLRTHWPGLDFAQVAGAGEPAAPMAPTSAEHAPAMSGPPSRRTAPASVGAAPGAGTFTSEPHAVVPVPAASHPESPGITEDTLRAWIENGQPELGPDAVRAALHRCAAALQLPALHRCIDRVRARESTAGAEDVVEWRAARGTVHQVLAERGSSVALYDLRETLERAPDSMTVSMLGALRTLGDASCLEAIATGWARSQNEWVRPQLEEIFGGVIAREHLTRRHAAMKRVAAHHAALVEHAFNRLSQTTRSPSHARRT